MKTLLVAVTIVAACARACAGDASDAQKLLQAAMSQTDLFRNAKSPFVLEAEITVHLGKETKGHLSIQWESKDHWRRELTFGPYRETVYRKGEWEYAQRNTGFTPTQVEEIVDLLQVAHNVRGFAARSEKVRHKQGRSLNCIQENAASRSDEREVCLDPKTNEIVDDKFWIYETPYVQADFSDYAIVAGVHYPRKFTLEKNSSFAAAITITKLVETNVDSELLAAPPGAVARRMCEGIIPADILGKPDLSGLVVPGGSSVAEMQLTIMKDGSVGLVQIMSRSSEELAEKIRRRALAWKFKPAMCGNEPVVSDYQLTLGFGT